MSSYKIEDIVDDIRLSTTRILNKLAASDSPWQLIVSPDLDGLLCVVLLAKWLSHCGNHSILNIVGIYQTNGPPKNKVRFEFDKKLVNIDHTTIENEKIDKIQTGLRSEGTLFVDCDLHTGSFFDYSYTLGQHWLESATLINNDHVNPNFFSKWNADTRCQEKLSVNYADKYPFGTCIYLWMAMRHLGVPLQTMENLRIWGALLCLADSSATSYGKYDNARRWARAMNIDFLFEQYFKERTEIACSFSNTKRYQQYVNEISLNNKEITLPLVRESISLPWINELECISLLKNLGLTKRADEAWSISKVTEVCIRLADYLNVDSSYFHLCTNVESDSVWFHKTFETVQRRTILFHPKKEKILSHARFGYNAYSICFVESPSHDPNEKNNTVVPPLTDSIQN